MLFVFLLERRRIPAEAELARRDLQGLKREWEALTGFSSPPPAPDALPKDCDVASALPDLWGKSLQPALRQLGLSVSPAQSLNYVGETYQVVQSHRPTHLCVFADTDHIAGQAFHEKDALERAGTEIVFIARSQISELSMLETAVDFFRDVLAC